MAVKIKLKRMGKIRAPHYRIIVADARTRRNGRAIEEIGLYNPKLEPSLIKVDSERVQYWLGVGAQPTDPVLAILKVTGDWQKHKGLPGADGKLREPDVKADKRAAFDAALAEVHGEPRAEATTTKKKPAKKSQPKAEKTDAPAESKPAKAAENKPAKAAAESKPAEAEPAAEASADTAAEPTAETSADTAAEPAPDAPDESSGSDEAAGKTSADEA